MIDLASHRNLLFTFDGKTFGPALHTPRAMVIYTRGQTYAEDGTLPPSQYDHQSPFIEFLLRFIGVRDVRAMMLGEYVERAGAKRACAGRREGSGCGVGERVLIA